MATVGRDCVPMLTGIEVGSVDKLVEGLHAIRNISIASALVSRFCSLMMFISIADFSTVPELPPWLGKVIDRTGYYQQSNSKFNAQCGERHHPRLK